MKLTVKERFFDKIEAVYVEVKVKGKANVIERDDERAQELITAGVVVPVEEKPEKEKKAPKKKAEEAPAE